MNKSIASGIGASASPPPPYSAEAEKVRRRCEDLIPLLRERALENENRRGIVPEIAEALRSAGAYTIASPKKWGGLALMPSEQARIIQTIGRGDAGVAWTVQIAAVHAHTIAHGTERLQEEVFSAGRGPTAGGGSPRPANTARKVDGGWMVKGRWTYGSSIEHADWVTGIVMTPTDDGGIFPLAFFLPKQPEWLLNDWDVMGLSSSGSASFELKEETFVEDYRCGPADMILAGPPPLPLAEEEPLYGAPTPFLGQCLALANALGCFEGLLDVWQEASRARPTMHPDFRTQAENPITHMKAGGYRAFLAAGQAVLDKLGAFTDELAMTLRPPPPDDALKYSAMFNHMLFETANQALDVIRDSSTASIFRTSPIQRAVRDLTVMNMHAASNRERNFEGLGRHLYGLPPLAMLASQAPRPPALGEHIPAPRQN